MYQILQPKFRFGLFLSSQQSAFVVEQNQPLICFADSYEIKEDGSIVFYQTGQVNEEKKFKIPVLAYAKGQWEACIFFDEYGQHPVFQGEMPEPEPEPPEPEEEEEEDNSNSLNLEKNSNQESYNDLDDLDSILGSQENISTEEDTREIFIQEITSAQNNPKALKQMKKEWLEEHIKKYSKNNDTFNLEQFIKILYSDYKNSYFNINEEDIVWGISQLIIEKQVLARKFVEPSIQKVLGFILPDIMRRHWDGKMAPILEILEGRDETKNVNSIDLAVWMVQNKIV